MSGHRRALWFSLAALLQYTFLGAGEPTDVVSGCVCHAGFDSVVFEQLNDFFAAYGQLNVDEKLDFAVQQWNFFFLDPSEVELMCFANRVLYFMLSVQGHVGLAFSHAAHGDYAMSLEQVGIIIQQHAAMSEYRQLLEECVDGSASPPLASGFELLMDQHLQRQQSLAYILSHHGTHLDGEVVFEILKQFIWPYPIANCDMSRCEIDIAAEAVAIGAEGLQGANEVPTDKLCAQNLEERTVMFSKLSALATSAEDDILSSNTDLAMRVRQMKFRLHDLGVQRENLASLIRSHLHFFGGDSSHDWAHISLRYVSDECWALRLEMLLLLDASNAFLRALLQEVDIGGFQADHRNVSDSERSVCSEFWTSRGADLRSLSSPVQPLLPATALLVKDSQHYRRDLGHPLLCKDAGHVHMAGSIMARSQSHVSHDFGLCVSRACVLSGIDEVHHAVVNPYLVQLAYSTGDVIPTGLVVSSFDVWEDVSFSLPVWQWMLVSLVCMLPLLATLFDMRAQARSQGNLFVQSFSILRACRDLAAPSPGELVHANVLRILATICVVRRHMDNFDVFKSPGTPLRIRYMPIILMADDIYAILATHLLFRGADLSFKPFWRLLRKWRRLLPIHIFWRYFLLVFWRQIPMHPLIYRMPPWSDISDDDIYETRKTDVMTPVGGSVDLMLSFPPLDHAGWFIEQYFAFAFLAVGIWLVSSTSRLGHWIGSCLFCYMVFQLFSQVAEQGAFQGRVADPSSRANFRIWHFVELREAILYLTTFAWSYFGFDKFVTSSLPAIHTSLGLSAIIGYALLVASFCMSVFAEPIVPLVSRTPDAPGLFAEALRRVSTCIGCLLIVHDGDANVLVPKRFWIILRVLSLLAYGVALCHSRLVELFFAHYDVSLPEFSLFVYNTHWAMAVVASWVAAFFLYAFVQRPYSMLLDSICTKEYHRLFSRAAPSKAGKSNIVQNGPKGEFVNLAGG